MATILVYDEANNRMIRYNRRLGDQMPFIRNRFLSVREFLGRSRTSFLWTTKRAMEAFNDTRQRYKKPIDVGYAFRRIWEGGHGQQSQHYAGTALDVGQQSSNSERKEIYNTARKLGVWGYVEPITMTPTWVHMDRRYGKPACSAGYPQLQQGSRGVYVAILQDALSTAGFSTGTIDGVFGSGTAEAVRGYQRSKGLTADGVVGCTTWQQLTAQVKGKGATSTTLLR